MVTAPSLHTSVIIRRVASSSPGIQTRRHAPLSLACSTASLTLSWNTTPEPEEEAEGGTHEDSWPTGSSVGMGMCISFGGVFGGGGRGSRDARTRCISSSSSSFHPARAARTSSSSTSSSLFPSDPPPPPPPPPPLSGIRLHKSPLHAPAWQVGAWQEMQCTDSPDLHVPTWSGAMHMP